MPKNAKHKDEKQKNAQRFINKCAAFALHEITVLNAYFCHADTITTKHGESAQGARKVAKSDFHAYYSHIIAIKHLNINATRPCRAYIAYFKP